MTEPAADGLSARWQALLAHDPARPALRVGSVVFTREEFETAIESQRAALAAAGVGARDIVAWLGINTPPMLATLLACERLGAVFMPLNWRLATDELVAIVRHAGVRAVRGSADMRPQIGTLRDAIVQAGGAVGGAGEPGDLMLVYTSGTTGRPKGAMHTAARMAANVDAAIAVQRLDEATRTLSVLPMFHVGGLCIQTLPTLLAGGIVCLHARFDPQAWFDDVAQWRPTTTLLVPATMRALVEHPSWATADLSSLAFVNTGSSVVPSGLIEAFHARGVPVAQVYGSTETGPVSIALDPREALAHAGSVGRPAPGVEIRLVDAAGADVAGGAVGEILVRAPNTMRGYHRAPDHPGFHGGWFHSGDLARRRADGHHEVVGRSKDMIISGGENIYPAEIENLVAGLPGVAECAVVGLPDPRWGEVPVLALVPLPGAALDAEQVRAAFATRLARFKHPRRIVVVDTLPKTALGKVQKAELAALLAAAG
jgi:fatty-acyl-CoA synthase